MIITEEKDFESSENLVHKIFNVKKDLPEQVFDKEFSNFTCEEFDWTESPDFWETTLKPLGQFFQDTHIIMTVLDADLRNYYLRTFGFYTTIKMPLTMTGEKYWEVLHTGPQESPQDAPFESANNVVWIASSGKWAIWGERGYCICILGFAENNIPKVPYGRGWWRPASEALEQLIDNNFKEHTAPQEFADTFLGNYFNK